VHHALRRSAAADPAAFFTSLRGTRRAQRGRSVPLVPMTSMMTTNRAAPGGAR
jgi:hypothetical protein